MPIESGKWFVFVCNKLESLNEPYIFAKKSCGICWMPSNASRSDRMIYASTLPYMKNYFKLDSVKTVYSQEEYEDLFKVHDRSALMSNEELVREDIMRRVEEEREELVKQHSLNKITEAAQSGGFHTITPIMTTCAQGALQSFQHAPPSLPNIGKWINVQLDFGNDKHNITLDIPVTKSIPLDQPFPINNEIPGVYFLSFLRDQKIETGQITYFPPGTSPKVKMMYAQVITSIKKQIPKTSFTLTVDDGKQVNFADILELIDPVVSVEPIKFIPRVKPARPRMVAKSVFISPSESSSTVNKHVNIEDERKDLQKVRAPMEPRLKVPVSPFNFQSRPKSEYYDNDNEHVDRNQRPLSDQLFAKTRITPKQQSIEENLSRFDLNSEKSFESDEATLNCGN